MVACGLEMCKGVLSVSLVHERGQEVCEIACSLVSDTTQHDCTNPSVSLAHTSNDRRSVCFTSQSTEKHHLETQGQVQH